MRQAGSVPLSGAAAGALVFACTGSVLVVEIIAARLLAPYVGLDIETYTAIIGVVLAGIAAGAWLGGRAADRLDPRCLLGPAILGGGTLVALAPPVIDLLGPGSDRSTGALVMVTLAAFFLPAVLLSAVSPLVVKMQLRALDDTGKVVGRYSAIGTAGALLGTFLAGFVLIPLASTTTLMTAVGVALIAAGASLLGVRRRLGLALASALAGGAVAIAVAGEPTCELESVYSCARVVEDPGRPDGRTLYVDDLRHSYVALEDPTYLQFGYMRRFRDVVDARWPAGQPLDALHLGGAGFSFPRYLDAVRPGSTGTVLELDAALVELAETDLGLERDEDLEVVIGDARQGLRELDGASFDLVLGDAFSGRSVPWQLTTIEALELIQSALNDDGLYLMNVIDGEPWDLARAELATMQRVFPHVAVQLPAGSYGNLVLVASAAPLPSPAHGDASRHLTDGRLQAFIGDAEPLRDDWAPVEQLRAPRP